eukprot:4589916-Prymnesium_polylepis.2
MIRNPQSRTRLSSAQCVQETWGGTGTDSGTSPACRIAHGGMPLVSGRCTRADVNGRPPRGPTRLTRKRRAAHARGEHAQARRAPW